MSKGAWIGTIIVVVAIGLGAGGMLYVNQQSQDRDLKEERAKNSSLSKKMDSADKKKATSEKKSSSHRTSSSVSESSSTSSASSSSEEPTTNEPVQLTTAQKHAVNAAFLNWAAGRAKVGNMAVTDWYFDHGAAGTGDWYANTTDGEIQVQDQNNPGPSAFPIHAIGGCVFLTMKDGSTGRQDDAVVSIAGGYGDKAEMSKPITKYMLGDNGKVYELKLAEADGSLAAGFAEYTDEGQKNPYGPSYTFKVSEDQAAQAELQNLLNAYR
ncbi:hypothetical protein [Weissella paramesenteroides]|uniref:hypothetical protein n=1 Tax=Weissella paramesenteroides TaxID=1249 RepID=UPI00123BEFB0|nr:hypothetical protein [Weissella paramesenteroides]KAA8447352.1 hypothetical protein FKV72_00740 [Weissella paramesenteroides]KAA8451184.1 hypothetical protein FKV71_07530 [Weissella paramesenteroides]